MPNWGAGAKRGATWGLIGSRLGPYGAAVGGGAGFISGLFSGDDKKKDEDETKTDPYTSALQKSATGLQKQGSELSGMGSDAMAPVLDYFKKLISGDPSALLEATKPERGRVIDQYDAARNAITNFGPRGGGSTSAMATSRISEANELSDITSGARSDAATSLAQIGPILTGLGLSAEQLASADLNSLINTILTREGFDVDKRGQNAQAAAGAGQALGMLLGAYLTRKGGAWGKT